MNKTERQLAIVLELQRTRVIKGQELAAKLETSVRTIYRDIQALSEAGVPIVGAPGTGYSLMEGYFLPPVSFTAEEAVTLLIGADFVERRFDDRYGKNAQSSRRKIEAILPEPIQNEAKRILGSIRMLPDLKQHEHKRSEKSHLDLIRSAMLSGHKLRFNYVKRVPEPSGNRASERTVAPLGLVLVQAGWMLLAHCDLRGDTRHFKVSRISNPVMTEERFEVPTGFNLHEYMPRDDRDVRISARFNPAIADRVKETNIHYMETEEWQPEGYVVHFRVRQEEELLQWILGWGADVEVLEPESFRLRVRQEIMHMMARY